MPYDAGVAAAVCYELNNGISGGRIEKIIQPAKEQIILQIYSKGERYNLCLDADANSPKVYITNQAAFSRTEFAMPSPSNFYNILRKYLMNGRLNSVSLVGFDRIFEFKIDAFDEMGFQKTLYLYVECIRKQSNIILCRDDECVKKIISALKTVDFSMSESRQVLNGLIYAPPSSGDKINPLEISHDNFTVDSDDVPLSNYLVSKYQGLSPLVTREIAFRASKDIDILTGAVDKQTLKFYFNELIGKINADNFTPTMLSDEKGNLIDFSYTDIRQYGNKAVSKTFDSMSELIDFYFYKKDYDNRIRQKSQDIFKVLANASSRLNKKIKLLEKELQECANKEKLRICGDLITANIYRLQKGPSVYSLENFYDEENTGNIIDIPVDKNLTPSQNAQKFYKKYNKLKSAEYHLTKQIESARNDIIYVDSVFDSLTRALSERELAEVRDELAESGLMKSVKNKSKSNKKPKQLPVSKPSEYKSTNGFTILCGKNNKQNDELTFKTASKNDIWFHAQKIPGSHVILVCGNTGRTPGEIDIEEAAKIAAAYSKGDRKSTRLNSSH